MLQFSYQIQLGAVQQYYYLQNRLTIIWFDLIPFNTSYSFCQQHFPVCTFIQLSFDIQYIVLPIDLIQLSFDIIFLSINLISLSFIIILYFVFVLFSWFFWFFSIFCYFKHLVHFEYCLLWGFEPTTFQTY